MRLFLNRKAVLLPLKTEQIFPVCTRSEQRTMTLVKHISCAAVNSFATDDRKGFILFEDVWKSLSSLLYIICWLPVGVYEQFAVFLKEIRLHTAIAQKRKVLLFILSA
jgi:hypothetical protein